MIEQLLTRHRRGQRPLLWDGGIGTALIARGLELAKETPESWLLQRPDDVAAVHAGFARAGVDVLQTNSFGLLRQLMNAKQPVAAHFAELVRASVALASAAAGTAANDRKPRIIVASLGPVVAQQTDAHFFDRLFDAAEQLAAWFQEAGAAAIHLETACDSKELLQTVAGVRAGAPRLPLAVSLTVSAGQSGFETPLGVPLSRMIDALLPAQPELIGVNCSLHARRMRPVVAALRELIGDKLPILAQPQVDQPAPDCKRPASPESPERFANDLLALLDEGADAVGGCCGTTAAHLLAARQALDRAALEALDRPLDRSF